MSEPTELVSRLENILGQVAEKKNIKNYKINFKLTEQSKNGFCSDMHFGSIVDKSTGKEYFLVIKKQFDYDRELFEKFFENIYRNEIYFYKNVLATFEKFQNEKNVINQCHEIPECFLTHSLPKAYLVLENLAVQGFKMWEKALPFPKEYLELIFKTYGKFHGISFAMKHQNSEDYEKLVQNFVNFREGLPEWKMWDDFDKIYEELKISNKFAAQKLDKYRNWDMSKMAKLEYKGKYKCIVHGDCWSNNMLFKYSEDNINKVNDIRLVDFQLCKEDSPIHDLSYFFYTGGAKKDFTNLDHYLKVYHDSFSACLSKLGCNARKLFPFEKLKSEWVEHCKFGFLSATVILKLKFTKMDEIKEKFNEKSEMKPDTLQTLKFDEEKYNQRIIDLILHLCDIEGL